MFIKNVLLIYTLKKQSLILLSGCAHKEVTL